MFQIFKECKEAEDKSVNLIYNCMNEHSLKYINQVFLPILPKSFQYTLCMRPTVDYSLNLRIFLQTAKDLHLGIVTDAKTLFKTLQQGKDLGDWMIT